MFIEAPEVGISTCRSKRPKTERTYDYSTASRSLVEDFESRPRKAVTFLVDRDKEIQEGRELKCQELC